MPFGPTNVQATFQNFMNNIFQSIADLFVIVYLDDIIVLSLETSEHKGACQTGPGMTPDA